jgi:hypothetical protein
LPLSSLFITFGNQVKESLDERCLLIQQELETFCAKERFVNSGTAAA